MRVLLIFAIAICISTSAHADCLSILQIHTDLHRPIKVYVDGTTGSNPPTVGVTVNGITAGQHHLKVVEMYMDGYGDRVKKVVYNGTIDVHASVHMDARVDEGRGIAIHDTHLPCGDQYQGRPDINTQPDNSTVNSPAPTPAAPSTPPLPAYMSDDDFRQLVNTVIAAKFEVKKLDTLRTAIGASKVSTDQVRQLMGLFSFESNKLDVAKMLYDHTVDKASYASLSGQFNFSAQQEAFKKFIAGK